MCNLKFIFLKIMSTITEFKSFFFFLDYTIKKSEMKFSKVGVQEESYGDVGTNCLIESYK